MKDKHVVVTGASSGIGRALALELSAAGAKITLIARRKTLLEELALQMPGPALVLQADLSKSDNTWLDRSVAHFGPVDVLVNNAGRQALGATDAMDPDRGDSVLQLNLHTPLRLMREVLPGMKTRGGTIVNVASLVALAPPAGMTWYSASKAGLAAASESLRSELRGSKVQVLTVYPGIIDDTDMTTEGLGAYEHTWALSIQPRGTASRLAQEIHRSIRRKDARLIYPAVNNVTRWFPATTRWLMDCFTPAVRT